MAARIHPLTESKIAEMRRRIQATLLLKRLEDHALGEVEMTATQIRAAEAVLRKAMPDLSSMVLQGDDEGGPVQVSMAVRLIEASGTSS